MRLEDNADVQILVVLDTRLLSSHYNYVPRLCHLDTIKNTKIFLDI